MNFQKTLITATILILSQFAIAQTDKQNIIEQVFNSRKEKFEKLEYGIVGLFKDKKGNIHKATVGWAAPGVKMTSDKIFNIGSLTKTFTAVLILQEIENGKISLNDSIGKFFPSEIINNPNIDLSITIENLLRHTSGLGEVIIDSIINDCFINPWCDYNSPNQFNHIPAPNSKKNEKYEYCNTNYILLGNILELINDKPYEELVRERIFKPCKMAQTFAYFSKTIPNAAHPIYDGQDLFEYVNFRFFNYYSFSAGGIASNVDDLSKFFYNLYSGKLFQSTSTLDLMTSFNNKVGLGLTVTEIPNNGKPIKLYGHDGDNLSFKCRNYYNPDTREQLIFLSNQYGEKELFSITNEILKELIK